MARTRLTSQTDRAVKLLTATGWLAGIVERQTGMIKRDLFGFADIVAVHEDWGTMAVQVTSASNFQSRRNKLLDEPNVVRCLDCEWRVELWGLRDEPDAEGRMLRATTFWLDEYGNLRTADRSKVVNV